MGSFRTAIFLAFSALRKGNRWALILIIVVMLQNSSPQLKAPNYILLKMDYN